MARADAPQDRDRLQLNVLVTGGLGYIGSHACVALAEAGHRLFVVDNLSNAKLSVLERLREVCGMPVEFERADVRDRGALLSILSGNEIHAVVHFAGLKAVGESVQKANTCQNLSKASRKNLSKAPRPRTRRFIVSGSASRRRKTRIAS